MGLTWQPDQRCTTLDGVVWRWQANPLFGIRVSIYRIRRINERVDQAISRALSKEMD